jgi:fatty acid desaturase
MTERRTDYPTLWVAVALYSGFLALTWFFNDLPWWVVLPLGGLLLAWWGSFQHETIHGRPTSSRAFNTVLASPPLALWLPYEIYRETHLRHHRYGGRHLTDPERDTESFYRPAGYLRKAGPLRRAVYLSHCTLAGRLLLGPILGVRNLWASELRRVRLGDRSRLQVWALHILSVALLLVWLIGVCKIALWSYILLVVYPGASLTQLRSFIEHRAGGDPRSRTAVVEAHPLWALVFLNNNLHIVHHAHPRLPWHQLPRVWRQMRMTQPGARAISEGLVFEGGYFQVVRKYLFRPAIPIEHPSADLGIP